MVTKHHIIGDIHGHGKSLKQLLKHLGYMQLDGVFKHPKSHKVVFLGDFIDRGPTHRLVLDIVKPMVEHGHAMAVMGNHEFNAICYHTPDGNGDFLRPHSQKNFNQHKAFLDTFPDDKERSEIIEWFKTLPLWLDLEGFRVIHACWHEEMMSVLTPFLDDEKRLTDQGYFETSIKDSPEYHALETLIKGVETELPDGHSFEDKDGNHRRHIRTQWWDESAKSYKDASIIKFKNLENIPGQTPPESRHGYPSNAKPLFIGHYWFKGNPQPILPNLACLDYSIAKGEGGKLVAYEIKKGEKILNSSQFIWC